MRSISISKYFLAIVFVTISVAIFSNAFSKPKKIESRFISFQLNNQKIVGTLTKPANVKTPPVVLILHGMGGNRFGPRIKNDGRRLFVRTAQILAENGIASLSISTRGKGGSEGDFRDMTLERRVQEALIAIQWLVTQNEFNNSNIAILGHSQGSLIATSAASRLASAKMVTSVMLWAPQSNALMTYRTSMGLKTYKKGLKAKPGEVVSWLGAGKQIRSFRTEFFQGLSKINTLTDIASFSGRLLIVRGKYDRWSTLATAQKIQANHQGDHSIAEFYVGHRMGASTGLGITDKVINHTIYWLKSNMKN